MKKIYILYVKNMAVLTGVEPAPYRETAGHLNRLTSGLIAEKIGFEPTTSRLTADRSSTRATFQCLSV